MGITCNNKILNMFDTFECNQSTGLAGIFGSFQLWQKSVPTAPKH